jgi:hypothetical protein
MMSKYTAILNEDADSDSHSDNEEYNEEYLNDPFYDRNEDERLFDYNSDSSYSDPKHASSDSIQRKWYYTQIQEDQRRKRNMAASMIQAAYIRRIYNPDHPFAQKMITEHYDASHP